MKKLLLSDCNECPFVGNIEIKNGRRSDYCFKSNKKIGSFGIPHWCSLPDASQQANSSDGIKLCSVCGGGRARNNVVINAGIKLIN